MRGIGKWAPRICPDSDRELNRLHIERGMSGKQVAEHLGIHPSTAIKYLRKYDLYSKENSYGKESQQNLPQMEARTRRLQPTLS